MHKTSSLITALLFALLSGSALAIPKAAENEHGTVVEGASVPRPQKTASLQPAPAQVAKEKKVAEPRSATPARAAKPAKASARPKKPAGAGKARKAGGA